MKKERNCNVPISFNGRWTGAQIDYLMSLLNNYGIEHVRKRLDAQIVIWLLHVDEFATLEHSKYSPPPLHMVFVMPKTNEKLDDHLYELEKWAHIGILKNSTLSQFEQNIIIRTILAISRSPEISLNGKQITRITASIGIEILQTGAGMLREHNNSISLTPGELQIILFLYKNRDTFITATQLASIIRTHAQCDLVDSDGTVHIHIHRLRRKLPSQMRIITERVRGYKLFFEVDET